MYILSVIVLFKKIFIIKKNSQLVPDRVEQFCHSSIILLSYRRILPPQLMMKRFDLVVIISDLCTFVKLSLGSRFGLKCLLNEYM